MKVFDTSQGWSDKVNFVDEKNVFVGYDMSQDCCEQADWFVSYEITSYKYDTHISGCPDDISLDGYLFDKTFKYVDSSDLDAGSMIAFKLEREGSSDIYLHLYNCHNGYYSHGFEFKDTDESVIESGYL